MTPSFKYTTDLKRAWWPSVAVAEGVAQFCNWFWEDAKTCDFHAETLTSEHGEQACIRVTALGDFTAYIAHPLFGEDF